MREESLVLQYRHLQKEEAHLLTENHLSLLGPSVKKLNALIEDKTSMDLLSEITKVLEPMLASYLKGYRPFQDRERRRHEILQGLKVEEPEEIFALRTAVIDKYVKGIIQKNRFFASFTGGVGAIGGIAVSMAELPVLVNTALKTMEYACEAYGNDPQHYFEKIYLLLLIPLGLIPDPENRSLVYGKLMLVETWMKQPDIPLMEREQFYPPQEAAAFCATHIATALVSNRLLQAVPVAGAVLGGTMNFDFVSRLGKLAQQVYKRRYLEKRLGL